MKTLLIKLCWPILQFFETEQEVSHYKKSHRVALIIVGVLFIVLSLGSAVIMYSTDELGAMIPFAVFSGIGLVALVVGSLGSNQAVAKIWNTR